MPSRYRARRQTGHSPAWIFGRLRAWGYSMRSLFTAALAVGLAVVVDGAAMLASAARLLGVGTGAPAEGCPFGSTRRIEEGAGRCTLPVNE
jgi:hypothetical protein